MPSNERWPLKKTWKKCHLWLSKHQHPTQLCGLWSFKQGLFLPQRMCHRHKSTAVVIESGLLWCRLWRVATTCSSFLGTWKSKPRRHDATLRWKFLIIKVGGISYNNNNLKVWLKYTFTTKHSTAYSTPGRWVLKILKLTWTFSLTEASTYRTCLETFPVDQRPKVATTRCTLVLYSDPECTTLLNASNLCSKTCEFI